MCPMPSVRFTGPPKISSTPWSQRRVMSADVSDAISEVHGATEDLKHTMEEEKGDVGGVALLALKTKAARVLELSSHSSHVKPSDAQMRTLSALAEPGTAHGYEFHSGEIIQTMEGVEKTEKKERADLDEEEFKLEAALEKKILGLQNQKKFAEEEKAEKEALAESKSAELAAAKEDEATETKAKAADAEFMKVLTEHCELKAKEFDQRSKMRADELTAISKATDALVEGVQPNYSANAKLVGLVQRSATLKPASVKPASFIQLRRSSGTSASQVMKHVLDLIKSKAGSLRSQELSAIALKISMQEDHFVKVRQMLKDLIAKLKADAEAEAEQKGFCDKSMMEATTARDEAKMTIESKTADISKNEAEKAQLLDDISNLQKAIAENKKALNEATELRNKEKTDNEKTLTDADAGKAAVEFALTTLKEFYEGAAFVQVKYIPPVTDSSGGTFADMAPKGFSGSYSGNQQQSKGIVGMLEVILSDFERTLDTVKSTEDEAQSKFDTFESETEADNKAKQDDVDSKEGRVADINDALLTLEDENSDAQKKLDGALAELEKLKPMCVSGEETYAERVAAREQEIAALKQAMQILIDWKSF